MKTMSRGARGGARASPGFSLVELTIAMSILVIVLVSGIVAQATSTASMRESHQRSAAVALLRGTAERVLAAPIEDLVTVGGDFTPNVAATLVEGPVLLDDAVVMFRTPGYTMGDPTPAVLDFTLELTWTGPDGRVRREVLDCARR